MFSQSCANLCSVRLCFWFTQSLLQILVFTSLVRLNTTNVVVFGRRLARKQITCSKQNKNSMTSNRDSDSNYQTVISKKNARKLNNNLPSPTSPGLQHIINNTPILWTPQSSFDYNHSAATVTIPPAGAIINDATTDNANDPISSSALDTNNMQMTTSTHTTDIINDITMSQQRIQQTFFSDYMGPVTILVESSESKKNLGN